MAGWIKLPRNITAHPLWTNPQYALWYIDLLIQSNHADRSIVDKATVYTLCNGQVRASVKDLCERWDTASNKTIINFLNVLSQFGLIKRELLLNRIPIINVYLPDDEQCNNEPVEPFFYAQPQEQTELHTQLQTRLNTEEQTEKQNIYKNIENKENKENKENNKSLTHTTREARVEKEIFVSESLVEPTAMPVEENRPLSLKEGAAPAALSGKKGGGGVAAEPKVYTADTQRDDVAMRNRQPDDEAVLRQPDDEAVLRQRQLEDAEWHGTVAQFFGAKVEEVPALVKRFHEWCDASGSNSHRDRRDLYGHFAAWYNRYRASPPSKTQPSTSSPKKTYTQEEISSKFYNQYYDPNKKHDRRLPFEPSLPRDPSAYYEPL